MQGIVQWWQKNCEANPNLGNSLEVYQPEQEGTPTLRLEAPREEVVLSEPRGQGYLEEGGTSVDLSSMN